MPARSPSSAIPSEDVVVARSACGQISPSEASIAAFVSTSSTIASTIRSAPSTSAGLVVTRTFDASPPSTLAQSFSTSSSARQAEVSLRARTVTPPRTEADAARPSAIAPLPAIAGFA